MDTKVATKINVLNIIKQQTIKEKKLHDAQLAMTSHKDKVAAIA